MKKSDYLKSLISFKNLKMKDVALQLGISSSALSLKINGHRPFKTVEVEVLLKILRMSYEEVFNPKQAIITNENQIEVKINNKSYVLNKIFENKITQYVKRLEKEKI